MTRRRRPDLNIGKALRVAIIVFAAAACAFSSSIVILALSNKNQATTTTVLQNTLRRELCQFADGEHNRERTNIVRGERLIYLVPAFKTLIATPDGERAAYASAKSRYMGVRATRPDLNCDQYHRNPVAQFPSLEDFRAGRVHLKLPKKGKTSTFSVGRGGKTTSTAPAAPSRRVPPRNPAPAPRPHRPKRPGRTPPVASQPLPPVSLPGPVPAPAPTPQNPRVPPRVCATVPLVAAVCTP
jgi:hypothetical protein